MTGNILDSTDTRPLIFISHSAADAELANTLQQLLDETFSGTIRFFNTSDREQLQLGQHWFPRITAALADAAIVLALLTPSGLRSPWVNFESGAAAVGPGNRLVPCAAGGTTKRVLPAPYGHFQAVDLNDHQDLANLFRRIESTVSLRLGPVDYPEVVSRLELATLEDSPSTAVDASELGHRCDHHYDSIWTYRVSEEQEGRLAATTVRRIKFSALQDGLDSLSFSWTPSIEAVKFDPSRPPNATLMPSTRDGYGEIVLAKPHAQSGTRFEFKVLFDPPLSKGEQVNLHLAIDFPVYKLGRRDDLAAFLLQQGDDLRSWDFSSITIENPTELFTYAVRFPKSLGIVPQLPQVHRFRVPFSEEEQRLRSSPGVYTVSDEQVDGTEYWRAQIERRNPPYQTSYRLCWKLPAQLSE